MDILDARNRGWFWTCVNLLQAGRPVELRVRGWQAKRLARAVSLGVLEAAAQGHYRVTANPTDTKNVLAFTFTREESS